LIGAGFFLNMFLDSGGLPEIRENPGGHLEGRR
jgi:hypothetical protein